MIIDLSHNVDKDTQVYPGCPNFVCCPIASVEKDGFAVHAISLGTHTGTHIDAPAHFFQSGATVTDANLDVFQGPALVIDVRGKQPGEKITWNDLRDYQSQMKPGVIAVIYTGWSAFWQSPKYIDHPFLDRSAAEGLMQTGIRVVAVDCLSVDKTVHEGETEFVAHQVILSQGGFIGENLTNLSAIADGKPYMLSVFPLKLTGLDGSPVRAVAWPI